MYLNKVVFLCLMLMLLGTVADAKIVFSSYRDGVAGIYVMDDDGSNETLLLAVPRPRWFLYHNCWSPNGQLILFLDRVRDPAVMRPDGTHIRQLEGLPDNAYIGRVSFSPDSRSIVFDMMVKIGGKWKESVNVLNIVTGQLRKIADVDAGGCDWSPDGKSSVYGQPGKVGREGNTLWIMGADGHNLRKLLDPIRWGWFSAPRWSPDGKQIVYLRTEYAAKPGFVIKAYRYLICDRNGKNIKELQIPKDWRPLDIDWMDDGKSVVFSAYVGLELEKPEPPDEEFPPANLYKYHIETQEITQLTHHPGKDMMLDWISDDMLSVTPQGKKKVTWGTIKK